MFKVENPRLISMDGGDDLVKLCRIYPNCEIEFESHTGGVKTTYTIFSVEDNFILTPLEDFCEYCCEEREILNDFGGRKLTVHSLPRVNHFTEDFAYRLNDYMV